MGCPLWGLRALRAEGEKWHMCDRSGGRARVRVLRSLGAQPQCQATETPRGTNRCLQNAPSAHRGINVTSITMASRCLDNLLPPEVGNSVKQIICVSV